jgi:quinoprotein dehydrogenase-associated probable ABC transporter substrate-binding protein
VIHARRQGFRFLRRGACALACLALAAGSAAQGAEGPGARKALRVCQDPNNLPFSNTRAEGIENRIAEIFGKALGLPVTYYSFPQRMAFIRNTLRFKLPGEDYPCDIVMGVPADYDQVQPTKAYYRSTYALVLRKTGPLASVASVDDFLRLDRAVLDKLRIGVFDRSPASEWLVRKGLIDQGVPFKMLDADPSQYPGQIIERELAEGRIDAAIVWGPIGGYYAKRVQSVALAVLPLKSEPGVKFDYAIAMGVRRGEAQWKQQVESLIDSRRADISGVLREFGVPLVNEAGEVVRD